MLRRERDRNSDWRREHKIELPACMVDTDLNVPSIRRIAWLDLVACDGEEFVYRFVEVEILHKKYQSS